MEGEVAVAVVAARLKMAEVGVVRGFARVLVWVNGIHAIIIL